MTSHELAKKLLEHPDMDVWIAQTGHEFAARPVSVEMTFDGNRFYPEDWVNRFDHQKKYVVAGLKPDAPTRLVMVIGLEES